MGGSAAFVLGVLPDLGLIAAGLSGLVLLFRGGGRRLRNEMAAT